MNPAFDAWSNMKSLYFFWYYLNGLEFVTYILIPVAIVLVILVYLYFNADIIRSTIGFDLDFNGSFHNLCDCFKEWISDIDKEISEKLKLKDDMWDKSLSEDDLKKIKNDLQDNLNANIEDSITKNV